MELKDFLKEQEDKCKKRLDEITKINLYNFYY